MLGRALDSTSFKMDQEWECRSFFCAAAATLTIWHFYILFEKIKKNRSQTQLKRRNIKTRHWIVNHHCLTKLISVKKIVCLCVHSDFVLKTPIFFLHGKNYIFFYEHLLCLIFLYKVCELICFLGEDSFDSNIDE